MFDIGFWELLIIGVIGLLVLGPERLPGAIRSTSRTIRNIKGMANGFKQEIEQQMRIQELHENLKKAEEQQLKNLAPELRQSVDELKAAADSVNRPYSNTTPPETDKIAGDQLHGHNEQGAVAGPSSSTEQSVKPQAPQNTVTPQPQQTVPEAAVTDSVGPQNANKPEPGKNITNETTPT